MIEASTTSPLAYRSSSNRPPARAGEHSSRPSKSNTSLDQMAEHSRIRESSATANAIIVHNSLRSLSKSTTAGTASSSTAFRTGPSLKLLLVQMRDVTEGSSSASVHLAREMGRSPDVIWHIQVVRGKPATENQRHNRYCRTAFARLARDHEQR
jgi:hypothetical protein